MNLFDVNLIIAQLTDMLIETSVNDVILPSTGVLADNSWYVSSLMFLMIASFEHINMFDEKTKESLFDIYNKQMLK